MKKFSLLAAAILLAGCVPATDNDPTANTYTNDTANFSFDVPEGVDVNAQNAQGERMNISVSVEEIDTLEGTLGYDQETAEQNRDALENGEYGPSMAFSVPGSERVVDLGNGVNGKTFTVFRRLEICDISFERTLLFYRDGYQVRLNYSGPMTTLIDQNPEYFMEDRDNCFSEEQGALPVWEEGAEERFLQDAMNGQASPLANRWYEAFEEIIDSIELQ